MWKRFYLAPPNPVQGDPAKRGPGKAASERAAREFHGGSHFPEGGRDVDARDLLFKRKRW